MLRAHTPLSLAPSAGVDCLAEEEGSVIVRDDLDALLLVRPQTASLASTACAYSCTRR